MRGEHKKEAVMTPTAVSQNLHRISVEKLKLTESEYHDRSVLS